MVLYRPIDVTDKSVKGSCTVQCSLIYTSMLQNLGKHLAYFQFQDAGRVVNGEISLMGI